MMSIHLRRPLLLLALCGLALGSARGAVTSAADATPTLPTAPATLTLPATAAVPPTSITLQPAPTSFPTVQAENSTPVLTVEPYATEAPAATAVELPSPTLPVAVEQPATNTTPASAPTSTPTPLPPPTATPSSLPTPAAVHGSSSGIIAPLPSPAQLELDARLRWGDRIPASVRRWAFLIVPAAHQYGLNPNLVAAVMTMESNGDPLALSPADARGLMQILHGPWDPKTNVYTGVRMLAGFLAQFGSLDLALAAYNAGPNAVVAYNGVPPYRETRDYVIIVTYLYDLYTNRPLSTQRKAAYRSTLKDLQHFSDQRNKVPVLARIAHIPLPPSVAAEQCWHFSTQCGQPAALPLFPTHDPFWPLGDAPDPLQHVDPFSGS